MLQRGVHLLSRSKQTKGPCQLSLALDETTSQLIGDRTSRTVCTKTETANTPGTVAGMHTNKHKTTLPSVKPKLDIDPTGGTASAACDKAEPRGRFDHSNNRDTSLTELGALPPCVPTANSQVYIAYTQRTYQSVWKRSSPS